ncbi:MAG: FG-GAP repeat protein, partial [Myxococcales bacterium]|nr:FG-GAP repeat protein [Myxococcales bacterium]
MRRWPDGRGRGGSAAGLSAAPSLVLESNLAGIGFGSSVASAGDVDGDGYDDVVVG